MAILCVGSINIDHVYRVPRIPAPGETLAATGYDKGAGGKGANQSIAAALAGARVFHMGCIGPEGRFAVQAMAAAGVDTGHVAQGATPTGHAIIAVDDAGENAITLFAGANRDLAADRIAAALGDFGPGDTLLLQNEVNLVAEAARLARDKGLRVVYSAAPFDAQATAEVVPFADILVLNEVEATQLDAAAGPDHVAGSVPERIITRGERGATWTIGADDMTAPAFAVDNVVDTTGAGDCFAGYLVAGLDAGLTRTAALRRAQAAAAIQITRAGAAAAIPRAAEVDAFLSARG